MDTKKPIRLAAVVIAALAVVGIGGAAVAQSGGSPTPTQTEQPNSQETEETVGVDDESPSYTSSITAPNAADDSSDGADDEAAEAEALAGLASITPDEARAAALAAVPGNVVQVELDNENGSVVYSVEVDTGNGVVDVKVDAGNGSILHQEADDDTEGNDD